MGMLIGLIGAAGVASIGCLLGVLGQNILDVTRRMEKKWLLWQLLLQK
jgi:hypothetical protein